MKSEKLKLGDVVTWESNEFTIGEVVGFNDWLTVTWIVLSVNYHGIKVLVNRLPEDLIKVGSII